MSLWFQDLAPLVDSRANGARLGSISSGSAWLAEMEEESTPTAPQPRANSQESCQKAMHLLHEVKMHSPQSETGTALASTQPSPTTPQNILNEMEMHSPYSETDTALLSATRTSPTTPRKAPPADPATIPRPRTSASSRDPLMSDECVLGTQPKLPAESLPTDPVLHEATEKRADQAKASVTLLDLPDEIQQRILDMLMGELQRPSKSVAETQRLRNWNSVMRHPKSRKLADLSLVCPRWRELIQERIYRHSKPEHLTTPRFQLTSSSQNPRIGARTPRNLSLVYGEHSPLYLRPTCRILGTNLAETRRNP